MFVNCGNFNGVPTKTCIGIGPNESEEIDKVTGHLKLF
jgi:peptidyl-tRNA hydrolase